MNYKKVKVTGATANLITQWTKIQGEIKGYEDTIKNLQEFIRQEKEALKEAEYNLFEQLKDELLPGTTCFIRERKRLYRVERLDINTRITPPILVERVPECEYGN